MLTCTDSLGGDEVAPGTTSDTLALMEDQWLGTVGAEPPITRAAEAGGLAGCGGQKERGGTDNYNKNLIILRNPIKSSTSTCLQSGSIHWGIYVTSKMSTFIVLLMKGASQIIQPGIFKISRKYVHIPIYIHFLKWKKGSKYKDCFLE